MQIFFKDLELKKIFFSMVEDNAGEAKITLLTLVYFPIATLALQLEPFTDTLPKGVSSKRVVLQKIEKFNKKTNRH